MDWGGVSREVRETFWIEMSVKSSQRIETAIFEIGVIGDSGRQIGARSESDQLKTGKAEVDSFP